jgi:hypothetical protein
MAVELPIAVDASRDAQMLGRMRLFYRTYPQLGGSMSPPIAAKFGASPVSSDVTEIPSPVTESGPAHPTPLDGHLLMQLPSPSCPAEDPHESHGEVKFD